jgi:hypothetical protein
MMNISTITGSFMGCLLFHATVYLFVIGKPRKIADPS